MDADKNTTALFSPPREDIAPEIRADRAELARFVRVNPDATDFNLVNGVTAANETEIAIQTRSIIQLMVTLAAQVEVPAKDLAEHTVVPGWDSITNVNGFSTKLNTVEI